MNWLFALYYRFSIRFMHFYHVRLKNKEKALRAKLLEQGRNRWLDMGSSGKFSDNFFFADLYPKEEAKPELKDRYFQFNATEVLTDKQVSEMGTFDLIRMQHVFEHFTPEGGQIALQNCGQLLNAGGYILISVPDLEIFIKRYRRKCVDKDWPFKDWAESRIEAGAPQSFYFSIFSHSVLYQSHQWCYDFDGLEYSLAKTGLYTNIKRLGLYDTLSEIPFTHNRPWEDVCILAQKK